MHVSLLDYALPKRVNGNSHHRLAVLAPRATSLEQKQATLRHFVRMVAKGHAHGLLCVAPGGNG